MSIQKNILKRFTVVVLFMFIPVVGIGYKLFVIQGVQRAAWQKTLKRYARIAPSEKKDLCGRGAIYSADGELLAASEHQYKVTLDFQSIKKDSIKKYLRPIVESLHEEFPYIPEQKFKHILERGMSLPKKRNRDVLLLEGLTYQQKKHFQELTLDDSSPLYRLRKGRKFGAMEVRRYPFGRMGIRTVGAHNKTGAISGVELSSDSLLASGHDLELTMDMRMQEIVQSALLAKLKEINADVGVCVLMEVQTGKVKAMVNLTRQSEGIYSENYNNALKDLYEPGSTFKTISMTIALEDGVVTPETVIPTGNGLWPIYGKVMKDHNWRKGGYGDLTAAQTIANSSNVGVSKIIENNYGRNPGRFVDGIFRMKIHEDLHLDIPGAAVPRIHHPDDPKAPWDKLKLAWMSIGYATQLPPIYTLNFYNAIANNGKLIKPIFLSKVKKNGLEVEQRNTTVINEQIVSAKTVREIQEMLEGVMTIGTGRGFASPIVSIAGKTGTAQIIMANQPLSHRVSFCGYFPVNQPKYSCICVITRPRIGYAGGAMPGAVFKSVAEQVTMLESSAPTGYYRAKAKYRYPVVKTGHSDDIKRVLADLSISIPSIEDQGEWVSCTTDSISIYADMVEFDQNVPNVVGMGAKDALYVMERAGFKVKILGRGVVRSQSVSSADSMTTNIVYLSLE